MLLYRLGKLSMEWKNPHASNCMKVRFVSYFLQILQKPLFTDTADTIFELHFELCQLRNTLHPYPEPLLKIPPSGFFWIWGLWALLIHPPKYENILTMNLGEIALLS